jgi:hypothetical protein
VRRRRGPLLHLEPAGRTGRDAAEDHRAHRRQSYATRHAAVSPKARHAERLCRPMLEP